MFASGLSDLWRLPNLLSFPTFGSSSRPSAPPPPPEASPDLPEDDKDLKKQPSKVEDDFDLDVETPGSREDWAKTPLPPKIEKVTANPGKFSDMERESLGVLTTQDIFDGFRMEYNRQSSNFLVGHSLSMGSSMEPANYTFMTQYFDKKFVMLGRIGTEGDFQGIINKPLNSWVSLRLSHHRGPKEHPDQVTSFETDLAGDDSTTCFKLQFHDQTPALTVSYNQTVTPCLDLGCEGQLNFGAGISALSTGFKYSKSNIVISGQINKPPLGSLGGHVNFLRKVDSRPGSQISYATQLRISPDPKTHVYKTEWRVAWDYKMRLAAVRGHIDSNGKIYSMLEQHLSPFMSLVLTGVADLWNHKYNFGIGLQIVLQELTEEQQKLMMAEEQRMREAQAKKDKGGDEEFAVSKQPQKKYM
jgi:hypothetical protein